MVDVYEQYYGRWGNISGVNVIEYKEGTLVVDIIDAGDKQVVWHGKTSDQVYENMRKVEEKINAAENSIFVQYEKDVIRKSEMANR